MNLKISSNLKNLTCQLKKMFFPNFRMVQCMYRQKACFRKDLALLLFLDTKPIANGKL